MPKNLKSFKIYYMNYKTVILIILSLLAGLLIGFGFGLNWGQKAPNSQLVNQRQAGQENALGSENEVDETDLYGVEEFEGSGSALREYGSNSFKISINTDLTDPQEGKYYEAWLSNEGGEPVSIGRLIKQETGWGLVFDSQTDYSAYNEVLVSLETDDDGQVEAYLLQASF